MRSELDNVRCEQGIILCLPLLSPYKYIMHPVEISWLTTRLTDMMVPCQDRTDPRQRLIGDVVRRQAERNEVEGRSERSINLCLWAAFISVPRLVNCTLKASMRVLLGNFHPELVWAKPKYSLIIFTLLWMKHKRRTTKNKFRQYLPIDPLHPPYGTLVAVSSSSS